jgi:hypothetical protein
MGYHRATGGARSIMGPPVGRPIKTKSMAHGRPAVKCVEAKASSSPRAATPGAMGTTDCAVSPTVMGVLAIGLVTGCVGYRYTGWRCIGFRTMLSAMVQIDEARDWDWPPLVEALPHRPWWPTILLCVALLAPCAAVLLFLVLVVAPSAGAAGGCGGG